jgi:hypothetical protein
MRRIAAVAVSAVTLAGGLALAAPAEAATHKFTAPKMRGVVSGGSYSRTGKYGHKSITITGYLRDTRRDGLAACTDWRVYNNAGRWKGLKQWRTTAAPGTSKLHTYKVSGGGVYHLYVADCKFKLSTGKASWTGWKKIF